MRLTTAALSTTLAVLVFLFCNLTQAGFYSQSIRRDGTPEEAASVVKLLYSTNRVVKSIGTGWWLKGPPGKDYFLVTARHAFNFLDMNRECASNMMYIEAHTGDTGRCMDVVAEDLEGDFIVLRVRFGFFSSKEIPSIRPLRITTFIPAPGTRLKMIGHPSDPKSQDAYGWRKLTTSENCWAQGEEITQSPWPDRPNDPFYYPKGTWFVHNCSIFFGNSGGPVIIEGTDLVVGTLNNGRSGLFIERKEVLENGVLKSIQVPRYEWRAPEYSGPMTKEQLQYGYYEHVNSWDLFIHNNRKKFEDAGIEIVDINPNPAAPVDQTGFDYLAGLKKSSYSFSSATTGQCQFDVVSLDKSQGLMQISIHAATNSKDCKLPASTLDLKCDRFPSEMCISNDEARKEAQILVTGFREASPRLMQTRDRAEWQATLQ